MTQGEDEHSVCPRARGNNRMSRLVREGIKRGKGRGKVRDKSLDPLARSYRHRTATRDIMSRN
jgi:hypothetical protein